MLRSRAISHCEPCQDRNIAALSNNRYVPRGSFSGVTYKVTASVKKVEKRCAVFLNILSASLSCGFLLTFKFFHYTINLCLRKIYKKF